MYKQIAIAAVLVVSLAAPAAATPALTDLSAESTTPADTQSLETTAVSSSSLVDLQNTSTLDANNTDPAEFADDVRVATDPANATADLGANTSTSSTFNVSVTGDGDNETVYVATSALAAAGPNATVSVDGTEVNVTTVTEANVTWYGFVAPNADNATVSVTSEADDETEMDDTDESDVADLNETAPANETTPANASDDVLVETPFASNASATLDVADENATLNLTVTGDAENVTAYVDGSALVGENDTLEGVSASIDGNETDVEDATDNGTTFYGFNVPDASDASVMLELDIQTVTYVTPLPEGVAPYDETEAVGGVNRVTPVEFSGKSRVGNASNASTSIAVRNDTETNFTADVTVDEDPENTTVYLRYDYAAGSAAPENVTVSVDNESVPFGVVRVESDDENTTWLAFEVANATDAQVTVTSPEGTEAENGAPLDLDGDDEKTKRPQFGSSATPPSDLTSFPATTPLTSSTGNVDPVSLSGKVRVDAAYAANTTVELVKNSSVNFTLTIAVPENLSENVTLYINTQALVASQGVDADALAASVDGNYTVYSMAGPGDSWVAVQTTGNNSTVTFRSSVFDESEAISDAAAGPPKNTDSDYLHEDIDGDGTADFSDVIEFAFSNPSQLNESLPADRRAALDFDGDGSVDFSDVVGLAFDI